MSEELQTQAGPVACPKCSAENPAGARFCEACGANLSGGASPKRTNKKLGNLSANTHLKNIKSARTTLIVVGVLTFLAGVIFHVMTSNEIAKLRANPNMQIDEGAVSQAMLGIYTIYALGVGFFALNFWAKSNPFAACLTGLIIYISAWLIEIAGDPTMIAKGIIIKLIIIGFLIKGVKAGIAYRKMQERGTV